MQEGGYNSVHVAPLNIRKSQKDLSESIQLAAKVDSGLHHDKELPDAPEEPYSPRPKFQNFLRASYPFQPQDQFSSTSVTIPLTSGDIVLVHSIHTNGWADGTLLETGARGWLPTNYCEPYDYATMRPLLKALTEFWDIIRSDNEDVPELHRTHDYMRGMVAGVRFLLEKSDCLTRDAVLVKEYDSIRRTRKGLLADLSLLVKASKSAQLTGLNPESPEFDEKVSDDLLLKAFQVVTRAVTFFDIWSEDVAFTRSPRFTSRSPQAFSPIVPTTAHASIVRPASKRSSLYGSQRSSNCPSMNYSRTRPASISRPSTVTHRMSYTSRNLHIRQGNMASEQLSDTYDAFLGVLASFLGSHMQSRSSSELLLTTQQAVKSCRKLLEVVEIILEHDSLNSDDLQQAKDVMYDRITTLVHAAREVFRPLHAEDDDMIYLPGEGARLVNAATACVSGAGRCVAKARVLLEDIGDFELELRVNTSDVASISNADSLSPTKSLLAPCSLARGTQLSLEGNSLSRLSVLKDLGPSNERDESSACTQLAESPVSPTSDSFAHVYHADVAHAQQEQSLARTMLHMSESTLVSSPRDSGPSFISETSTRATSPDAHVKNSPKQVDDDHDDDDDALLEHHYAHELVVSSEGRLIGGSLNAIIERLTSHEATPNSGFVTMVYLTFRLFANPLEFAQALVARFEYIEACPKISHPVRLRVSNVFKGWLESHWRHDCDEPTIPYITSFFEEKVTQLLPSAGSRLLDLVNVVRTTHAPAVPRILSAMGKTNTVGSSKIDPDQPAPPSILSKSQLNALKMWKMGGSTLSILEFDPMELARQITIKTSAIFCSVLPEELLGCEFTKPSSSLAVNLRAMAQLSTDLNNLVVESILQLEDTKKRAMLLKQWIKVTSKCLELHNYETFMTINASLNTTAILRLKKTWELLGQKTKLMHDYHTEICSHEKNYACLRRRFESAALPCLPYVGIYRTDLIFTDQGNPAMRELQTGNGTISVINLGKHARTAEIISDLQRFQIPYKLTSVDELQTWLQDECVRVRAAGDRNVQNQYRRSLILEPKFDSYTQQQPTKIKAFASMTSLTGKDRFDFLTWTHNNSKERVNNLDTL